jgi:hypothetical protein
MENRKLSPVIVFLILFAFTIACSTTAVATPTATATATPIPATPTNTPKPTLTPRPTRTPNVIETQNYEDIFDDIQKYKDEGLISTTDGEYTVLDDFSETMAQRGWLNFWFFDFTVKNFVYKSHVNWSTSDQTSDTSGCGIVFAVQPKGDKYDYYGVVLDKSRIFFSTTYGGYYYDMGKTRGTGKLDFGNPAEADFTLIVNDYKAFVYVDGEFIGEYTLSKDRELAGQFGYGIISGTNHDYGTRCEITNSRIWKLP